MSKEELGTVPNEEEFASFKQALKDLKEGYEERKMEIYAKHTKEMEKMSKRPVAVRNQPYRTARIATHLKLRSEKLGKEANIIDRRIKELEGLRQKKLGTSIRRQNQGRNGQRIGKISQQMEKAKIKNRKTID